MRLKSFVIAVVTLFVIANVIVAAIRRCGVAPGSLGQEMPPASATSSAAVASPAGPAAVSTTRPPPPAGIEGLDLQLSRPLMFDLGALGGLAADEAYLYVAAWDNGSGVPALYQVHADSYSVAQVRALSEAGVSAVGGIDAAGGRIWLPLARGGEAPATVVLGVDAATLEVRARFEAAEGFVALAATDDGRVYGVSGDGERWAEWLPDGTPVREADGAGGVRYADLAYARGSLVAAGSDGTLAVIDVIEPRGFTLLARHPSPARGTDSAWVTGGGLEVHGNTVLLLPEGGARPSLLTYVPVGGDLERFVPSLAGAGR